MIEIRWHGRGGQGAVTSVELLALAAIQRGRYAQGFPNFGAERRGAPVAAFNRIADEKIKVRSGIYNPDVVVVLDASLIEVVNVIEGLKPEGTLIVNTDKTPGAVKEKLGFSGAVATVDATSIAWDELGIPITNTTMLGAVIRVLFPDRLAIFEEPLRERFGRLADKNINALKRAYEELQIVKAA